MSILVTGGAGYIGAHVVSLLAQRNEDVIVVDNLSTGLADRIGAAPLIELDLAASDAKEQLVQVMRNWSVESVIHIAALKQVGESMANPLLYYRENVGGMIALLSAMEDCAVKRLVFSSSAATYGMPGIETVTEATPTHPISPYGQSKLIGEWMTAASASAWGLRPINLRYFNVAGAQSIELADPAALNLIPIVINKVLNGEEPVIYGNDYPTPDGTCIRDYVHIGDLADAHLAALDSTAGSAPLETVLNVGTGHGASVSEVLDVLRSVSGRKIDPLVAPRRPGDPPKLIADVTKIQSALGWSARRTLIDIVESAWLAEVAKRGALA
ncbi:UDP-glucose 4-epimerase GalE [Pseudarthrobacter quantipunctorum]|uniref:UDP-glucose 4-epimerase n=1 Tax=Pseudarthrobacter quantipunctorum TaxID=3128980 RepID=A0ABZ2R7L6_9MICC